MALIKQIDYLLLEIVIKLSTEVYFLILLFSELPHSILELILQSVLNVVKLKITLLFEAKGPQVECFLQVLPFAEKLVLSRLLAIF